MPTVTITFNTDNAAFEDDYFGEVAHIMFVASRMLEDNGAEPFERKLLDTNGNTIGTVKVTS